ncbi:hypothetical protein DM02DRAFT_655114 [Periconia macrospinosa]|uniref:Uncharacterized protein n=1 Tax=Periconia macrospinosa TaxID=97972 RepID=A0A2V1DV92_9PLEO|nr:hypothetical protein DM02DRAFT_655114 [Periconia macrospinosa]
MSSSPERPPPNNLFIATSEDIWLKTLYRKTELWKPLFQCQKTGILNACASSDNSGLLAVADSQLVILHDAASYRGNNRKYRLEGAEVAFWTWTSQEKSSDDI